jgi:hypothetical protein
MKNVGPINGAHQFKSGKEFMTDLFQSDNDEDNIMDENNVKSVITQTTLTTENPDNATDDSSKQEAARRAAKLKQESSQFRDNSQKILLNLSKPTLRNIVMLICDEAVR